jgi:hypothetical protein
MARILTRVLAGSAVTPIAKKPVILFRTDFRGGSKIRGASASEEEDDVPYDLMLTESATRRLNLPFATVDSVADSIDQALQNLPSE